MGILFPEVAIPLELGGVFLGENAGTALGMVGGKIASSMTNDLIKEGIIEPTADILVGKFKTEMNSLFKSLSKSPTVTCRSDICHKGYAEHQCKCVECTGPMEYTRHDGASKCQTCMRGYTAINYNDRCLYCTRGSYGGSNGCVYCVGEEYSDTNAATKCKTCPEGTHASTYASPGNSRCLF